MSPEYSAEERARDKARMEFKEAAAGLADEGYTLEDLLGVLGEVEALEGDIEGLNESLFGTTWPADAEPGDTGWRINAQMESEYLVTVKGKTSWVKGVPI